MLKPLILASLTTFISLAVASGQALAQAGSLGDYDLAVANVSLPSDTRLDGSPSDAYLVPASLLQVPDSVANVVWVEMTKGRLHLLTADETGALRVSFSRPISIGKEGYGKEVEGDNRTPVGLYHITDFLPDEELIDMYGNGAFPLNYPNRWDRLNQRTGYGIWIHGLPKQVDQRPLLDSEGCVVIDNLAFDWLMEYLQPGSTRVMLGEAIDWTSPDQRDLLQTEFRQAFDGWLASWSAIDNDTYLNFYADNFRSDDRNLDQWVAYKQRIHAAKSWIEVEATDLGIYQYPGEPDMIVTEYYQTYRSSNYNANGLKQLYWRRQADGTWKIIYEGAG